MIKSVRRAFAGHRWKCRQAICCFLCLSVASLLTARGVPAEGLSDQPSAGSLGALTTTRPEAIRVLANETYFPALLGCINSAREQIDMGMFLFKVTDIPDNRPAAIMQALIEARKRGVAVRICLENSGYDEGINEANRKVEQKLKENDIAVVLDTPRKTTHAKLIVIDRRYILVGSHNLTHAALTSNNEFSVLIDSRTLAEEAQTYLQSLPLR
jgi:phosphatidylserine/phosphatidylglycerophosphate/cardiolipin synthase-like enzyme